MKKYYESPMVRTTEFDLEGFICESIKKAMLTVEVDEYDIMEEEQLYL